MEGKLYKERYGGNFPALGTSWWFSPQILRFLDDRGLSQSEIFAVMDAEVNSKDSFERALLLMYPERQDMIEQVFSRY